MDLAGAVTAKHIVMQRTAFTQRHANEIALGSVGRLADRFRHFARLAVAEAGTALLIADDDERGEAEAASALHDLRDAVDVNELVRKLVTLLAFTFSRLTCHC